MNNKIKQILEDINNRVTLTIGNNVSLKGRVFVTKQSEFYKQVAKRALYSWDVRYEYVTVFNPKSKNRVEFKFAEKLRSDGTSMSRSKDLKWIYVPSEEAIIANPKLAGYSLEVILDKEVRKSTSYGRSTRRSRNREISM